MSVMSAAVVVQQPPQHQHQHQHLHLHYTPQQRLQFEAMNAAPWEAGYVSQEERDMAAQLAHLASQHQLSDYNRLKFGGKGAPFSYVPISIQFPAHVDELRVRQAKSTLRRAWFPSSSVRPPTSAVIVTTAVQLATVVAPAVSALKREPSLNPPLSDSLQQELCSAIDSQMSLRCLPITPPAQSLLPKTSDTHPINISLIVPFEVLPLISAHLGPQAAYPSLFSIPPALHLDRLLLSSLSIQPHICLRPSTTPNPAVTSLERGNYPPVPYPPAPSRTPSFVDTPPLAQPSPKHPAVLHFNPAELASSLEDAVQVELPRSRSVSRPQTPTTPTELPRLGNLLLSSCPGKKVRLTGPVKGRGAICRDLKSDLLRVRDLGVGCIVCCLDDDELEFLGASWNDYSQIADSIGIDVLRLPTPEGLAPLKPSEVDIHLNRAIDQYTLKGVAILVHCRGGVGRAGLIACCWMLKLGLVGSDDHNEPAVHLVQRVINVVRRRRSVKAIETYEQVRFLVQFVEHLRERRSAVS